MSVAAHYFDSNERLSKCSCAVVWAFCLCLLYDCSARYFAKKPQAPVQLKWLYGKRIWSKQARNLFLTRTICIFGLYIYPYDAMTVPRRLLFQFIRKEIVSTSMLGNSVCSILNRKSNKKFLNFQRWMGHPNFTKYSFFIKKNHLQPNFRGYGFF